MRYVYQLLRRGIRETMKRYKVCVRFIICIVLRWRRISFCICAPCAPRGAWVDNCYRESEEFSRGKKLSGSARVFFFLFKTVREKTIAAEVLSRGWWLSFCNDGAEDTQCEIKVNCLRKIVAAGIGFVCVYIYTWLCMARWDGLGCRVW